MAFVSMFDLVAFRQDRQSYLTKRSGYAATQRRYGHVCIRLLLLSKGTPNAIANLVPSDMHSGSPTISPQHVCTTAFPLSQYCYYVASKSTTISTAVHRLKGCLTITIFDLLALGHHCTFCTNVPFVTEGEEEEKGVKASPKGVDATRCMPAHNLTFVYFLCLATTSEARGGKKSGEGKVTGYIKVRAASWLCSRKPWTER